MKDIIEIKEEVKIGNVILEKGDKIKVLPKLNEGVAETILQQLGGKRFQLMTGAKQISKGTDEKGNEYLSVKFPKGKDGINHVQISLTPRDTYDIKFGAIRGVNYTVKATFEDIYADMLVDIFEKTTGLCLYLSL